MIQRLLEKFRLLRHVSHFHHYALSGLDNISGIFMIILKL